MDGGLQVTDQSNNSTFVLTFCHFFSDLLSTLPSPLDILGSGTVPSTNLVGRTDHSYQKGNVQLLKYIKVQKVDLMKRTCHPSRRYKLSKVIHNMFYTMLGVVQFTVWEAIFVHCYATNRLPYLTNQQALSSPWNMALFLLAAFWVPLYRDVLHIYAKIL